MALIPFAEKKLIRPGANDPPIIPIGIIWHVDAGNTPDLFDFFKNRSGGIESHGHIRKDGHLYQYRNTGYEADANHKANSFWKNGKRYGYLSFETQGYGAGEWTDEQIATMKEVNLWGHEEYGIPLRVCRGPQDPGIGYHTLFGAPSAWTPVSKSCPGPDRKKQFNNIIVPWMKANPQEDDMDYSDWSEKAKKEFLADIKETLVQHVLEPMPDAPEGRYLGATIAGIYRKVVGLEKSTKGLAKKIESLTKEK